MSNLKFGRKPPTDKPALKLSAFLASDAATLPPHPVSEDFLAKMSNWQMLGNDYFGDCVSVTWANERRTLNYLAGKDYYPTQEMVWELYRTQNPNFQPNPNNPVEDNGMVIQTCLEYLNKNGGPDGVKSVAFAKVDHTNLEEVKAALAIFGVVWIGINVQAANMAQFNAGQVWDYVSTSKNDGGHSVVTGGYLGNAQKDIRFVTWAQETTFTDNFWTHQVEEAWVVIWPEHLGSEQFQAGTDLNALASAYKQLTGRNLPLPTPQPTPTPTPAPTPTPSSIPPEDQKLLDAGNAWEKSIISHFTKAGKLKDAFNAWKQSKGY